EKLSSISITEVSDVTSPKLGLPNGSSQCETCGSQSERDCDGHFGVTKLAATVHNPYFIDEVVHFLNQICPGCLNLRENIDLKTLERETVRATCKYCSKDGSKLYPSVIFKTLSSPRVLLSKSKLHRSPSVMERISIVAEAIDRGSNKSKGKGSLEGLPQDYWDFVPSENQQLQSTMTKIILSPYQVFHMLKKSDPELIKQFVSRRELLFLSCLPVTPNCHRVVEIGYGLSDGRLTFLYSKKTDVETSTDTYGMKWLKDAVLSKRSDNAFRSIMVGDPKIRLWEIGIPENLASNLVVSEHVSSYNLENINLKCNLHLLAKEELLIRRNGKLMFIRKANQLEVGDIAYRPLQDGDLILINRPPSVHQHSLIALSTKILPIQSVVSINPLCCMPFLGDFDGDCMNFSCDSKLHIIDSEVLTCSSGSSWLQNSTTGLFSIMFKQYGRKALDFLSSAQEVLCEFLTMRGLSVSLSDLYMFSDHYSRRKLTQGVKLALDEAEEAFRIKQILLDPINIPVLKCHDETEDVTYRQSDYIQSNLSVVRSSIMSFKDVFNDLLKMVQHHVSNDNSMMVMINAGSKGSMLKYVQQTACVGLQLPASKFPFRIPSQLSCVSWNRQKSLNCEAESTSEHVEGQNLYAVIRNSFIEGLNPLECLLHAISGRANFFSEHADVPGTLTRKLMYHLRDLHVAYDGTVRSSYGQHIMQFSYDTADDMCCNHDLVGELGAPVGSWAACSISEAAYGALDHPVNGLEDSPLMNLQEVFKCHKATNSGDHVGLLFLSKHLKKYRYSLEYASLEVKNHLERVNFSDLVETIMIIYDGCDKTRKGGPWTTHFHISKEMMKKKRLGLGFVVEELTKEYDATRNQLNNAIPSVHISKRKCSVGDQCVQNSACCITLVAQAESNSMSQLDTIKKRVIPSILDTLLKGFLEFKDVEIQCRHDGELLVKVGMSEHCKAGRFWATLQNACIPVMELIDWEQSQPKNVYDIFCSYGIDSAWKCFVESLKSVTSDIGRNVRREHLLIVADSLSVTGQFQALSSQGLNQQRSRLSISSPFSEACFSRPARSFINAAKHCSVDNLCGSLDAIAWGKEPFNGTSGPFEIMHAGKPHEPEQNESIYDFLRSPEVRNFEKDHMDTCRQSTENALRCRLACKSKDSATVQGGAMTIDQGFLHAKVGIWDNIIDMRTSLQNMLREYPLNGFVKETDKSQLVEALKFHPNGAQKIGVGVREIKIGLNPSHPGTRCFILLRKDGTTEDFSYNKCVQGAANSISPQLGSYFEKKLHRRA
uniref:DNA-directed RNA polymerase n=1 Tax=Setaria italica TaxID=4555 RepID=A0A0Q3PPN4_SETIT